MAKDGRRSSTSFTGITVRRPDLFDEAITSLRHEMIPFGLHDFAPWFRQPGHDMGHVPRKASRVWEVASNNLWASGMLCEIDRPPETIDTRTDPNTGNLVLKCAHAPSHSWRLDGSRIQ